MAASTNITFHFPTTSSSTNSLRRHLLRPTRPTSHFRPVFSARLRNPNPPPSPSGEVYQPFRPPPAPLPDHHQSLSPADRLEILRTRMGMWYDYAPLIKSLARDGFTPPSIEEATGISGIEQNLLAVSSQVRESLISAKAEPDVLAYFDSGGSEELLYEIRLLSVSLRVASARYIMEQNLDAKSAQQLARAIKDFPRRRGDKDWKFFSESSPGDCLAYTYFRLSMEAITPAGKLSALEQALQLAETENAKGKIVKELEGDGEKQEEDEEATNMAVPIVRLRYGEVAEATSIAALPVCSARDGEDGVLAAPQCRTEGNFEVVVAEAGWKRWLVLPKWEAIRAAGDAIAIEFADPGVLPWRTNMWHKGETVIVIADRRRKEVQGDQGFYLVGGGDGELKVEKGKKLKQLGLEVVLGTVVLLIRPPNQNEEEMPDWD